MKKIVFFLLILVLINFLNTNLYAATRQLSGDADKTVQRVSNGHVIGFRNDGVFFATGSHVLHVIFQGTPGVVPSSELTSATSVQSNIAQPLQKVIYKNLWRNIDLSYDAPDGGIARSTYTIRPRADAAHIRLKYNTPVQLLENGTLQFIFKNGILTESEPVAWQIIQGRKTDVAVAFIKYGQRRIGFKLGSYDTSHTLFIDPTLQWKTFMGGDGSDRGDSIAVDSTGNVLIFGHSTGTWGSPLNPHSGLGKDAFAAKLSGADGALLWNTFMGLAGFQPKGGIAVDSAGDVFVTGESVQTWGAPLNDHAGGEDAFAAKLSGADGALLWNTFMGSSSSDEQGRGVAVDSDGDVFITGDSMATWGVPLVAHSGMGDAFAVKLSGTDGTLLWNTFMGMWSWDDGAGIAVDSAGDVLVTGQSAGTWGAPLNAHAGVGDAFAAKLSGADGALLWNTFLGSAFTGSSGYDEGRSIAVDSTGDVLITGISDATWGLPQNAHTGGTWDAFAAKLNGADGALLWNTFMGRWEDYGNGIAVDSSGDVLVAGQSDGTWGTPLNAHSGGNNAFAAKLSGADGALLWNTFLGSGNANGIATNSGGDVFVTGNGGGGGSVAFIAMLGDSVGVGDDPTGESPIEPPPPVPTVADVSLTTGSGPYTIDTVITINFSFDYQVWVKGTPLLVLNTGGLVPGTAYYSGGSGTKIITFQYTVVAGDDITKLDYWSEWALELNGGQIYSNQGIDVDLELPAPGEPGSLGYNNALGVLSIAYPVYRFYSPGLSKHFLTTDENEKEYLLANAADVWQLENAPYSVFLPQQYNAATQKLKDTLIAVHRFYNAALQTHLYTVDENETAHLIAEAADVWQYEGPVFYVPVGNPEGTIPIYRFYSESLKAYLFTADENEMNHLIDNASDVWNFEGIAYYAYP